MQNPMQSIGPEAAAYADVVALGLEQYAAELDANGYTIVPPDKVGPPALVAALRSALLRLDAEQRGAPADLEYGTTHARNAYVADQHMFYLLLKDPVFEQALMNPAVLALATYLLGGDCVLHSLSGTIKGPSDDRLPLHTDNNLIPSPFPPYAQIVNVTMLLSDYSHEDGATCFWPGSHRFARHPLPAEVEAGGALRGVSAPSGSLLIWNGGTWHGAAPRTKPGLRLAVILLFGRSYITGQETLRGRIGAEQLARNPARFATLTQQHIAYPFGDDGPDYEKLMANAERLTS